MNPGADDYRTSRSRKRERAALRDVLTIASGLSMLCTWLPGIGGFLLLLVGLFVPAMALIGVLILAQWPLMFLAMRLCEAERHRHRSERQAFLFPEAKVVPRDERGALSL